MNVISFRNIRIVILLSLFALAATYTQNQRLDTASWYQPSEVTIFPINGDSTANSTISNSIEHAKIFMLLPNRRSNATAKEINWVSGS